MESIPSILGSAQQLLSNGFARLDQSAAQIVASASPSSPADSLLNGIIGMSQAHTEVDAGAALLRTYQRTADDLIQMSDPAPRYQHVDRYA